MRRMTICEYATRKGKKKNTNNCVSCGREIPEGQHVCSLCMREAEKKLEDNEITILCTKEKN